MRVILGRCAIRFSMNESLTLRCNYILLLLYLFRPCRKGRGVLGMVPTQVSYSFPALFAGFLYRFFLASECLF